MPAASTPVIYLHIGAMKTGTTFLQQLMMANQQHLLAAGYLFPGEKWGVQARAVRDILGRAKDDPELESGVAGTWAALREEMLAHRGTASILSMEFLSYAEDEEAARVVESLAGAEVHVVLTVRDATGALPAQWQTLCRNDNTISWPDFAHGAMTVTRFGRRGGGQGARAWQRTQGIPRMLTTWGRLVPRDRLHVVTVPPSGSDPMLLWQRFATVVGIDPTVASEPTGRSNPSLGQVSADLLRRVNRRLGKTAASDYHPIVRGQLAANVLSQRASREQRATLDRNTLEWAARWNQRVRKAITRSGAHLVGDLDDLPVRVPKEVLSTAPDRLTDPDPRQVLDAAVDAWLGMAGFVQEQGQRAGLGSTPGQLAAEAGLPDLGSTGDAVRARWDAARNPLEAAVGDVSDLVRLAITQRRRRLRVERTAPTAD